MHRYDPDAAPVPALWMSLDERARIRLAEEFHQGAGIIVRNIKLHAAFHAVVENQIAEGMTSIVRAMARLQTQGLSRHDCVHAIGWVLSQHFHDLLDAKESDSPSVVQSRYNDAVERLDAVTWRAQAQS